MKNHQQTAKSGLPHVFLKTSSIQPNKPSGRTVIHIFMTTVIQIISWTGRLDFTRRLCREHPNDELIALGKFLRSVDTP
ncbi:MAG TPA: hypothetical protein VK200_01540, partial [Candidatus Limnocylindrales bacterium]|nr:hypothetical protein [Candidatus Limnocylindrales bacterium]